MNPTLQLWQNASNYSVVEISTYYSNYLEYVSWDDNRQMIRGAIRTVCGIVGLIGYLLEVLVLRMPDFNNVSFIYQKALTYLEVAEMVFTIVLGAIDLVPMVDQSATVLLFYQIIFWLSAATGNSCTYLVLVIVIERFVALWLPFWFGTVNRKPIVYGGIALAMVMGCEAVTSEFETSGTVFDSISTTYKLTTYVWVKDVVYQTWLTFRNASLLAAGYALTVMSILVAIGFSKLSKSKIKVTKGSDKEKSFKLNKQLSTLSLICSVPLGIYVTLQTVYDQYLGKYTVGLGAVKTLSYDDAMYYVFKGKCAVVVRTLQTVVFLFAHCFHFYFYIAWCQRFRNSTISYVNNRTNKVWFLTGERTTVVKHFSSHNQESRGPV